MNNLVGVHRIKEGVSVMSDGDEVSELPLSEVTRCARSRNWTRGPRPGATPCPPRG